jgi:hypothetical protein
MVEEIGMSEKRALEISGHKTRSCLADIQESGQKMDKWIKAQRAPQAEDVFDTQAKTKILVPGRQDSGSLGRGTPGSRTCPNDMTGCLGQKGNVGRNVFLGSVRGWLPH